MGPSPRERCKCGGADSLIDGQGNGKALEEHLCHAHSRCVDSFDIPNPHIKQPRQCRIRNICEDGMAIQLDAIFAYRTLLAQVDAEQLMAAINEWPMRNVRWLALELITAFDTVPWSRPLLAQMTKLESLILHSRSMQALPPLPSLKHLDITVDMLSATELASIATLHNLETLKLTNFTGLETQKMPDLCLEANSRLQAVCLVYLVPNKVSLHPTTKLTVQGPATDVLQNADALLEFLIANKSGHGLHLSGNAANQRVFFDRLLSTRGSCYCLTALSLIDVLSNNQQVCLGSSVAQLRFLHVEVDDGNLEIDLALPNLRALVLRVHGNLELIVDNLEATGARLETLYIEYRSSEYTMVEVGATLKRVCHHEVLTQPDVYFTYETGGFLEPVYPDFDFLLFNFDPSAYHSRYFSYCHTASGACEACIPPPPTTGEKGQRKCCPRGYVLPEF